MNKIDSVIHAIKKEPWSLSVSGYIYSNKGDDLSVDMDIEDVLDLLVKHIDNQSEIIGHQQHSLYKRTVALEKIVRVNAMDYEYQRWAKESLL